MHIVRNGAIPGDPGSTFSGDAELATLLAPRTDGGLRATLVRFRDGARTHWHVHPGEQILWIVSGQGRVGNAEGEWEVGPGDLVHTLPGERHWHGAAAGQDMTHLSVTNIGAPEWQEPVAG